MNRGHLIQVLVSGNSLGPQGLCEGEEPQEGRGLLAVFNVETDSLVEASRC